MLPCILATQGMITHAARPRDNPEPAKNYKNYKNYKNSKLLLDSMYSLNTLPCDEV